MDVVNVDERDSPEVRNGVFLAQLAAGGKMSVQHFRIQPGSGVDDHSHEHEQAGYLVSGEILFTVDGEEYTVEAGDSYVIPGNAVHAATSTGDEAAVGVELFSPPRPNPPWSTDDE